jgi:hypothetical protein
MDHDDSLCSAGDLFLDIFRIRSQALRFTLQKIGTAPTHSIGTTDAQKVADGTITSSPGLSPNAKNAASNPAVPLLWASA